MYAWSIEIADETLVANQRVRMASAGLRAEATALIVRYRSHRFRPFSGASDASDERGPRHEIHGTEPPEPSGPAATIRSKIRSGVLPLPAEPPGRCWAGKGTGRWCSGCDNAIASSDIEYEVDIADGRTLRFHDGCVAAWHGARGARMTARDASDE